MVTVGKPTTFIVLFAFVVPQEFVAAKVTEFVPGLENEIFGDAELSLPMLVPETGLTVQS